MTDDQLRRLQETAAEAAGRADEDGKIVYLPHVRRMPEEVLTAEPIRPMETMRQGLQQALDFHRNHPGTDHLDAAFAVAGRTPELAGSRWPEFVAAVREVTDASATLASAEREAER